MNKLHIYLLMALAIGSLKISAAQNDGELNDLDTQTAKAEVMQDLVEQSPDTVNEILHNEGKLNSFSDILNFIRQIQSDIEEKSKNIELLSAENTVKEADIAKLAVELADTQQALQAAIDKQNTKHRKKHKLEQKIKDALAKAEQGLKTLNDKFKEFFDQNMPILKERLQTAKKRIANHVRKAQNSMESKLRE